MPTVIYKSFEEATLGVEKFIKESGNVAFVTARREKFFGASGGKQTVLLTVKSFLILCSKFAFIGFMSSKVIQKI